MQASNIPVKFQIPWANGAGGSFVRPIPQASQIAITPGAASLQDGFPPTNFQPVGSGGVPPFGQDMNGILKQITAWNQWAGAGGTVVYDATFSTAIGGYPQGAIVASTTSGAVWLSLVDNNTSNPDAGGAGWIAFAFGTQIRTRLTSNLNLYVRTDGSDSNNGFTNTPSGAFLTLQKATTYATTVDTAGFTITVNVANGTYAGSGAILAQPLIGGGNLFFVGNPGSPSSCVISNTNSSNNMACFDAAGGGQITVNGFRVTSTNGNGLFAQGTGSVISYLNMDFNTCLNGYHVNSFGGGQAVIQVGTYAITQTALGHFLAQQGGTIYNNAGAQTINVGAGIGMPTSGFATALVLGSMILPSLTFTGSALTSGTKYNISLNSVLSTNGGLASFPAPTAGSTSTGGQAV